MPPETYFWNDNAGCVGEFIDTTPKTRVDSNSNISKVMQRLSTHVRRYKQTQLCIGTFSSSTPSSGQAPPPPPKKTNDTAGSTPLKLTPSLKTGLDTPSISKTPVFSSTPIVEAGGPSREKINKGIQALLNRQKKEHQATIAKTLEEADVAKAMELSLIAEDTPPREPCYESEDTLAKFKGQLERDRHYVFLADFVIRMTDFEDVRIDITGFTQEIHHYRHIPYVDMFYTIQQHSEQLSDIQLQIHDADYKFNVSNTYSRYCRNPKKIGTNEELQTEIQDYFTTYGMKDKDTDDLVRLTNTKGPYDIAEVKQSVGAVNRINKKPTWMDMPRDECVWTRYFQCFPDGDTYSGNTKIIVLPPAHEQRSQAFISYADLERTSTLTDPMFPRTKWHLVAFICREVYTDEHIASQVGFEGTHFVTYMRCYDDNTQTDNNNTWYIIDDTNREQRYTIAPPSKKLNDIRSSVVKDGLNKGHAPCVLFYMRHDMMVGDNQTNLASTATRELNALELQEPYASDGHEKTTIQNAKTYRLPYVPYNSSTERCWLVSLFACLARTGSLDVLHYLANPDQVTYWFEELHSNSPTASVDVADALNNLVKKAKKLSEDSFEIARTM